jgi:hypothetical protein
MPLLAACGWLLLVGPCVALEAWSCTIIYDYVSFFVLPKGRRIICSRLQYLERKLSIKHRPTALRDTPSTAISSNCVLPRPS